MRPTVIDVCRILANSLYQRCNEGASYNVRFEKPEKGYMISWVAGPVFDSVTEVSAPRVAAFL